MSGMVCAEGTSPTLLSSTGRCAGKSLFRPPADAHTPCCPTRIRSHVGVALALGHTSLNTSALPQFSFPMPRIGALERPLGAMSLDQTALPLHENGVLPGAARPVWVSPSLHNPTYQKSTPGGVEALGAFTLMRAKRVSRYGGKQPLTVFKVVFSLWSPARDWANAHGFTRPITSTGTLPHHHSPVGFSYTSMRQYVPH
jgi:hypothetical protein